MIEKKDTFILIWRTLLKYDLYGPPAGPSDFGFWALSRCRCVKHLWAAKAQILIGLEVEKD